MKEINIRKVYEVDGKIFDDYNEALTARARSSLLEWARQAGLCAGGEWNVEAVVDAIFENRSEVRNIINFDIPSEQLY